LRFNYSKSLARPSIRELSDAAIVDNEFRTLIYGNSDLKMVTIHNFDFRAETYFKKGHNASISAFYKDFNNHIEMGFGSAGITWDNIEKSRVLGLELEGNIQITRALEFKSNVTLVKSEAEFIRKDLQVIDGKKVFTPLDTLRRPMFGQAPYLINSILSYTADSLGLSATVSYNVQGPRLVIAGAIVGRPDVYEMPRSTIMRLPRGREITVLGMIDFKVNKKINDHWSASLTIRDILNTAVRRSYQIDRINEAGNITNTDGWYDYDNFRYGTTYQLSVQYKI
jgi:outer membrane receptor protein involved in Fe transport